MSETRARVSDEIAAWAAYRDAAEAFHRTRSPETTERFINAYAAWCKVFAPEHADALVSDLRAIVARCAGHA